MRLLGCSCHVQIPAGGFLNKNWFARRECLAGKSFCSCLLHTWNNPIIDFNLLLSTVLTSTFHCSWNSCSVNRSASTVWGMGQTGCKLCQLSFFVDLRPKVDELKWGDDLILLIPLSKTDIVIVAVTDLSKIWPLSAAQICRLDYNAMQSSDHGKAKELLDFPWWHFEFCLHMSTVRIRPFANQSHGVGTELSSWTCPHYMLHRCTMEKKEEKRTISKPCCWLGLQKPFLNGWSYSISFPASQHLSPHSLMDG